VTRRGWRWTAAGAALAALVVLAPSRWMDCDRPDWVSRAPDGAHSLTACARPMLMAMPGGGGDNDGWLVLRDARGFIQGAVDVSLIRQTSNEVRWAGRTASIPLVATLHGGPERSLPVAFATDRLWRLRGLVGLTPTDAEFR